MSSLKMDDFLETVASARGGLADWDGRVTVLPNRMGYIELNKKNRLVLTPDGKAYVQRLRARRKTGGRRR